MACSAAAGGSSYSGLHEECGVFGVAGDKNAAALTRLALHSLQHRGQDGAGIVSWSQEEEQFYQRKDIGLVSSVFTNKCLDSLAGSLAIGHVRYGTTGGSSCLANVQPLGEEDGQLWVAHNGNIVNYPQLRSSLESKHGRQFVTTSDTELLLHLIAVSKQQQLCHKIADATRKLHGSFSLVFLAPGKLLAVRDPFGMRPLAMGITDSSGAVVFASETCALDQVKATYQRDVEPGEMLLVEQDGTTCSIPYLQQLPEPKHCLFELIYLANPSSYVFGHSVYGFRHSCGEILAHEAPPPVDCVVVPVPDSAVAAAIGYSKASGAQYQHGLVRSHHVARTFIEDVQDRREEMVAMKFAAVREVVHNKSVVLVDDSLVRGTTSKIVVKMLREAGAKEVHLRIASPKVIDVCYYGVNISTKQELSLSSTSTEQVCRDIGADSLHFISMGSINQLLGGKDHFCNACFTGKHLTQLT